jgi:hypothetical protein
VVVLTPLYMFLFVDRGLDYRLPSRLRRFVIPFWLVRRFLAAMDFQITIREGHVIISEGQNLLNRFFIPDWINLMEKSLNGGDYLESVQLLRSQFSF